MALEIQFTYGVRRRRKVLALLTRASSSYKTVANSPKCPPRTCSVVRHENLPSPFYATRALVDVSHNLLESSVKCKCRPMPTLDARHKETPPKWAARLSMDFYSDDVFLTRAFYSQPSRKVTGRDKPEGGGRRDREREGRTPPDFRFPSSLSLRKFQRCILTCEASKNRMAGCKRKQRERSYRK